jgi:hypothetical protein
MREDEIVTDAESVASVKLSMAEERNECLQVIRYIFLGCVRVMYSMVDLVVMCMKVLSRQSYMLSRDAG